MSAPAPCLSPRAIALRRHREVFSHALAHGMTLAEAEAALARARWEAAQAKLAATQGCGRRADDRAHPETAQFEPRSSKYADAPWMMRD